MKHDCETCPSKGNCPIEYHYKELSAAFQTGGIPAMAQRTFDAFVSTDHASIRAEWLNVAYQVLCNETSCLDEALDRIKTYMAAVVPMMEGVLPKEDFLRYAGIAYIGIVREELHRTKTMLATTAQELNLPSPNQLAVVPMEQTSTATPTPTPAPGKHLH